MLEYIYQIINVMYKQITIDKRYKYIDKHDMYYIVLNKMKSSKFVLVYNKLYQKEVIIQSDNLKINIFITNQLINFSIMI